MYINEIFQSISGERGGVIQQGDFVTFIRFQGCNLFGSPNVCPYCDTPEAQVPRDSPQMQIKEIVEKVNKYGNEKIVITGGEPLLQMGSLQELTSILLRGSHVISVETNGTMELPWNFGKLSWVIDFKNHIWGHLSTAEQKQEFYDNFAYNCSSSDVIKFIVESEEDIKQLPTIIANLQDEGCEAEFTISPIFPHSNTNIRYSQFIEWVQKYELTNSVSLNIQMHKLIGVK